MQQWIIKMRKKLIVMIFLIVLLLALFKIPLPYEILLPGGITNIDHTVEVTNGNSYEGTFNSSYVAVITKPSPIEYIYSKFIKHSEVVPLSDSQKSLSVEEINHFSQISKVHSITSSVILAYEKAGADIEYETDGLLIAFRAPDFPIFEKIRIGDVVTKLNGNDVTSINDYKNQMQSIKDCSESLSVSLIRDEEELTIQTEPALLSNKTCGLGVLFYENYKITKSDPLYTITDDSGYGSSSGLLQTLSIYNQLTAEDITHGKKISGTGVIDIEGNILPIAGIRQKVMGAVREDVDIFFAPNIVSDGVNLYTEAVETKKLLHSDITIVPVETFDEALAYLRTIN